MTSKSSCIGLGLLIMLLAENVGRAEAAEYRRLSVREYRDKVKAGWIGQIAGVSWSAGTGTRLPLANEAGRQESPLPPLHAA